MVNTINMQDMRHLNLFEKITRVRTRFCFPYNEMVVFCVPKSKLAMSLGSQGSNLRRISEIIKKRIRILPMPRGPIDARYFIQSLISPATFKDMDVTDKEIIITAGGVQNKATLLGRNKKRLEEMKSIVKNFFNLDYRVV